MTVVIALGCLPRHTRKPRWYSSFRIRRWWAYTLLAHTTEALCVLMALCGDGAWYAVGHSVAASRELLFRQYSILQLARCSSRIPVSTQRSQVLPTEAFFRVQSEPTVDSPHCRTLPRVAFQLLLSYLCVRKVLSWCLSASDSCICLHHSCHSRC